MATRPQVMTRRKILADYQAQIKAADKVMVEHHAVNIKYGISKREAVKILDQMTVGNFDAIRFDLSDGELWIDFV